MLRRLAMPSLLLALALGAAPAHAATVSVEGGVLRVSAGPGEYNKIWVGESDSWEQALPLLTVVDEGGAALVAGAGCAPPDEDSLEVLRCALPSRVEIDAGDGDDEVRVEGELATVLRGGDGEDSLSAGDSANLLYGGDGDDSLSSGDGDDVLDGGSGDDRLYGGDGSDRLLGRRGADAADGGDGPDRIEVRDRLVDSTLCGDGRDFVRAEVLDSLDFACERVDYGPAGRVGRLRTRTGGGRFVPVPGQPGTTVDRRILPDVLQLIRRYHIDLGDCFARTGHTPHGEHPLGLACDIVPGPGGNWDDVDRLARWAEPRQNRPRPPFRWVGYRGDEAHGRGDHLHLSWDHSGGPRFKPVRTVWVWEVRAG